MIVGTVVPTVNAGKKILGVTVPTTLVGTVVSTIIVGTTVPTTIAGRKIYFDSFYNTFLS